MYRKREKKKEGGLLVNWFIDFWYKRKHYGDGDIMNAMDIKIQCDRNIEMTDDNTQFYFFALYENPNK